MTVVGQQRGQKRATQNSLGVARPVAGHDTGAERSALVEDPVVGEHRWPVVLLPGGILPAGPAYEALLTELGEDVDARASYVAGAAKFATVHGQATSQLQFSR